ncbi:nitrogen permease regulator of amino acid transport activity 3-domain-containing protein [Rhodocollybia butyracea]|uniref:Nitrogen permease regulator 3 n=1 Tax=Rhodocollybia butyracea TaxID=206335 RepID=A0A9P5PLE5_9AGAR|nr:nitrogen permease regulator of amino acid transport activity 3-domain-containing protein [Rhodocollybia butyracea]
MAETLLAILLVNSSAQGSTLVYHWPPDPVVPPRLRRALPVDFAPSNGSPTQVPQGHKLDINSSYLWERPCSSNRDRSLSFAHSPSSGRNTPAPKDLDELEDQEIRDNDKFQSVFGYSSEFLASILCPKTSMCHQKFQLIVDDLAFIGHPVIADSDGVWRFTPEKVKPASSSRGRNSRNRGGESGSASPALRSLSLDKERGRNTSSIHQPTKSTWLHTFNFVLVLDLPDPSSSASGNVTKYFDVLYEQIVFVFAAVLFQEQVLSNFVEQECDMLGSLKEECIRKGESYSRFSSQALEASSVAASMKTLYSAIKSSSMAYLSIHELPLELQLPPYLDSLLHSEEDNELDMFTADASDEVEGLWGPEMSFGWQLPVLAPWKSLLLMDDIRSEEGEEAFANLRSPYITPDDRPIVEGLMKFLEIASISLSLADLASLLDWDLETQVFPTVRWLVQHRKAKVVDIINPNLKTVFTLPAKFTRPLSELTANFEKAFRTGSSSAISHSAASPPLSLPEILSTISTSSAKHSGNHFFASVVQSKELIPLYHEVISWMLKFDLLIVLHLRIRIVATPEVKSLVKTQLDHARERAKRKKRDERERGRKRTTALRSNLDGDDESEKSPPELRKGHGIAWLSLSPKSARKYSQSGTRVPSSDSAHSELSELVIDEDDDVQENPSDGKEDEESEETEAEAGSESVPSMINDPGRATPLQRRWLNAMSLGKDQIVTRRFELINQYFDGKTTDDEILYRADISRKQLREVLHHYDEFLQTFLHPS